MPGTLGATHAPQNQGPEPRPSGTRPRALSVQDTVNTHLLEKKMLCAPPFPPHPPRPTLEGRTEVLRREGPTAAPCQCRQGRQSECSISHPLRGKILERVYTVLRCPSGPWWEPEHLHTVSHCLPVPLPPTQ